MYVLVWNGGGSGVWDVCMKKQKQQKQQRRETDREAVSEGRCDDDGWSEQNSEQWEDADGAGWDY